MTTNRRKNHRVTWNMEGLIMVGRARSLQCTVSDLSNGGAKISCTDAAAIPDEFVLDRAPGGTLLPRSCRVVWRAGREFGVEFVYPGSLAADVTQPQKEYQPA